MKRLFVITMLLFASCSPTATKISVDNSVFADSSCSLPCWQGIAIGSTTKQELLDILSGIPIVNQDSITVTESVSKVFDERVYFTMGKGAKYFKLDDGGTVKQDYLWSGDIAIRDDKVVQVILSGTLGVTFQELIDKFGEPGYAIPFYTPGGHIWVEAIYPSQGLDFGYRAKNTNSDLTPDTPIDQIKLFDARLHDELTQNKMFSYLLFSAVDIEEYAWKGYGNINTYWHTE